MLATELVTIQPDPGHHAVKVPMNMRAVLVDTKGPEVRTGELPGKAAMLQINTGVTVQLHTQPVSHLATPAKDDAVIPLFVDYAGIARAVFVGGEVLLDDGLLSLTVTEIDVDAGIVTTIANNGGPIQKNKGVNLPNATLDLPALTDKDKRDLQWACEMGADFVAASFIRTAANVRSVTAYLDRCIAKLPQTMDGFTRLRPLVISKIESKEGVDNFAEILRESDGIMVARGDLGVGTYVLMEEMSFPCLPSAPLIYTRRFW